MIRRFVSVFSQLILVSSLLLSQAAVLATTGETVEPGCEPIDWQPVPDCYTDPIGEPGIGTDYSDLVGTGAYPAAFYCFDETPGGFAHFRERIVGDPTTRFGFKNAAWVVLFDFDTTEGYEYLISLSGKQDEWVTLFSNRVGERQIPFLLDPTNVDGAEDILGTRYPAVAPYASDSPDDSGDYWFATWGLPIQMLVDCMPEVNDPADFNDLIESGHLKLYYGTAEDDNNYNKDVLDCCVTSSLTVCKVVVNDDGGTATAHDWDIVLFDDRGNEVARQTPASDEDSCVTFTLSEGTYTIVEEGPDGYEASYSGDSLDGTISLELGDSADMIITNDDKPATVTLHKTVNNDDGGTLVAHDFQAYLDGNPVAWEMPIEVLPGSHTVSEDSQPGYSASSWTGDCDADGDLVAELGNSYDCYITNDDQMTSGYSISGHKYCCGDGECSNTGIEGWEITLVGPLEDEPVQQQTTLTDEEGYYEFTGLAAGTYIVSETPVEDWESCTPEDATIVVGPGSGAVYSTPGETKYQEGSSWLPAVAAWEPNYGTDPSFWDTSLTGHSFSSSADWVWESYRVQHPVSGDVVNFRQQFTVPGTPGDGDLWITVDNGYEVYLNGTFVGTAQVHNAYGTDWQDSLLYEAWVNGHGWESVEHFDVSALLVSGVNTLIIETANEYMSPADNQITGTISANPAGLIFELTYTTEPTEDYVVDFCNSPVAEASSNSPVCVGSDIELTGGPAGMDSYSWTGPNGFSSEERNPTV